jgi:hypothetical protein
MGHKSEHGGIHGFQEIVVISQKLRREDASLTGSRISYSQMVRGT